MSVVKALLVAGLSTVFFALLHWRGIALSPDGWAYWQAAVSIANRTGYRDFSGTALTAWPPLYPLYLSLWVRVMGATGLVLVVANGVLVVLQSVTWFSVICHVWNVAQGVRRRSTMLAVAFYVALYVPLTLQAAHSANLGFLFDCLMLLATWQVCQAQIQRYRFIWMLAAIAAATLALLSHNINVAFVAACAAALLLLRHRSRSDFVAAGTLVVIPLVIWVAVRWHLGQLGSHSVGLSISQFNSFQYVMQLAMVIGNLIVPSAFGAPYFVAFILLAWCVWVLVSSTKRSDMESARFTAAVLVIACALIVLLFSVTSVTDPIGARFVAWVPILVVPAVLVYSSRVGGAALLVATAICLTPNLHRIAVFAAIHAEHHPQIETGVLFPIRGLISPDYTSGPPVQTDRGLLIAPPK